MIDWFIVHSIIKEHVERCFQVMPFWSGFVVNFTSYILQISYMHILFITNFVLVLLIYNRTRGYQI